MSKIKVLLADDHRIVRQGVRALLEAELDMEVVGEVGEGLAVFDAIETYQPDTLILDLMMPGINGLEVAKRVNKLSPDVRIVILSMHSSEAYVLQALRNGAYGYVLKDSSTESLVTAIRNALAGCSYLSPSLYELKSKAEIMNAWHS